MRPILNAAVAIELLNLGMTEFTEGLRSLDRVSDIEQIRELKTRFVLAQKLFERGIQKVTHLEEVKLDPAVSDSLRDRFKRSKRNVDLRANVVLDLTEAASTLGGIKLRGMMDMLGTNRETLRKILNPLISDGKIYKSGFSYFVVPNHPMRLTSESTGGETAGPP